MTIKAAIHELQNDPDFCRGFRRGIGLILASWVISQILMCAFYPLLGVRAILLSAAITTGLSIVFVARGL